MAWSKFEPGKRALALRFAAVFAMMLATVGFAQEDSQPAQPDPVEAAPQSPEPATEAAAAEQVGESVTAPAAEPAAPVVAQPAKPAAELAPRFELRIASVRRLLAEAKRSRAGGLLEHVAQMALAQTQESVKTLDGLPLTSVAEKLAGWPDTSVAAFIYAPDVSGKARWLVALDLPPAKVREALEAIVAAEAFKEAIDGLSLIPRDAGVEIRIGDEAFAHVMPVGDTGTLIASHLGLAELSSARKDSRTSGIGNSRTSDSTGQSGERNAETGVSGTTPDLVTCRLNLTGTEKDSGATFFSSFSVVTAVEYSGRVNESGEWQENVKVLWPTIAGMGAKAFFDRVKQTFFVPESALGAMVANITLVPGMLESMAGFGPQMVMEGGEMTMIGEPGTLGPIVSHVDSEFCMTVLPGTGFIPAPDIVVQTRARKAEEMMENLQAAAKKLNEQFVERDQPAPWHEGTVWDKPILWNEGAHYPGAMLPFVMRPVLFVSEEKDAKDRERSFLVVAWTTTSPERFVERWMQLPRNDKSKHLPTEGKTDGQMWINWQAAYQRFSPYANVMLGTVSQGQLLPPFEKVKEQLSDGLIAANLGYNGLTITHAGPLPLGAMVVPPLGTIAAAPDEFGSSDLARERLATQRLEVLYHHAKLFHKDIGRWPAEVAELDGYVDFSGHPELLELNLSSSKRWRDWIDEMFKETEKKSEEDEEVEDVNKAINDRLYVIEWGKERWTLGLAPGTLEHLEKLYIDQDGAIHRVEKNGKQPEDKPAADQVSDAEPTDPDAVVERVMKQAANNIARTYGRE